MTPSSGSASARPGANTAPARFLSNTMGRCAPMSAASSASPTSHAWRTAARSGIMTANALPSRRLRARNRATASALFASHAKWKPPRPFTAKILPAISSSTAREKMASLCSRVTPQDSGPRGASTGPHGAPSRTPVVPRSPVAPRSFAVHRSPVPHRSPCAPRSSVAPRTSASQHSPTPPRPVVSPWSFASQRPSSSSCAPNVSRETFVCASVHVRASGFSCSRQLICGPHSKHASGCAWKRRSSGSAYSAAQRSHMGKSFIDVLLRS